MWTVYNEFGEVVCEVLSRKEAYLMAIEYNGTYKYVSDPYAY